MHKYSLNNHRPTMLNITEPCPANICLPLKDTGMYNLLSKTYTSAKWPPTLTNSCKSHVSIFAFTVATQFNYSLYHNTAHIWVSVLLYRICVACEVTLETFTPNIPQQDRAVAFKKRVNGCLFLVCTWRHQILKSKPGGLQNFYLLLMKDYLKIYLFTIP